MRTKSLKLFAVSFILILGCVCAHICEIDCFKVEGKVSTTTSAEGCHSTEQAQNNSTDPKKNDHSSQCKSHELAGDAELTIAGKLLLHQLLTSQVIDTLPDIALPIFQNEANIDSSQAFRSPPPKPVFSILRI